MDIFKTLLLIIDVQNDFCPGGALAVNEGDEVVKPLNELAKAISFRDGRVAATQDWHPAFHVSFASSYKNKNPGDTIDTSLVKGQTRWPEHCVQGTNGAAFHKDLNIDYFTMILRKGFRKDLDSYSAFYENDRKTPTGLEGFLRTAGIENVIIGGLATDYCVYYSAMDCKKAEFKTIVVSDAVRGVGLPEGSVEKAVTMMRAFGIEFQTSVDLLKSMRSWKN
jgi:nicotinamidase/pyrazinamidase